MSKMTTHLLGVTLFIVAALITILLLGGCGGTSDPQGDAYKAAVRWGTDLSKSNYYDVCSDESVSINKGFGETVSKAFDTPYTDVRACAISYAYNAAQGIMQEDWNIYDNIVISPVPVTPKGHPVPKNGYVFEGKSNIGKFYLSMQRDSSGDWKVVGADGA